MTKRFTNIGIFLSLFVIIQKARRLEEAASSDIWFKLFVVVLETLFYEFLIAIAFTLV